LDKDETGWDCHDTMQTRVVFGPNKSAHYRHGLNKSDLAYWGVDCADYCPRVCQFHFFSEEDCQNKSGSYEIHGNPWGDINRTARYQYYKKFIWNNKDPEWKSVHINRDSCNVQIPKIKDGAVWDWKTYGQPGCQNIDKPYWWSKISWKSNQPCDAPDQEKDYDFKKNNQDSKIVKLVR